jgi:hypothetical protein
LKEFLWSWRGLADCITEEKIRWAIKGFGFYKTADENGIFPGLLQQEIETLSMQLCKIVTACLAMFPKLGKK